MIRDREVLRPVAGGGFSAACFERWFGWTHCGDVERHHRAAAYHPDTGTLSVVDGDSEEVYVTASFDQ
jgi:hypothetical protein